MLAAWAKQSMLNDYLPQLRDRSAVVQNGRVTLRRNRDRIRLPQRTTLQKIEMRYVQRLSKVSGWLSKMMEARFAGVEGFAPLAGPATAGEKRGK